MPALATLLGVATCVSLAGGARIRKSSVEQQSSSSGCANYRRIEDGTCAEACIRSFVGICPKSAVISAGSLQAGTCAPKGYTAPGEDLVQQAGPCGFMIFKTYTNPAALVQVEKQSSSSSCANYRRIEDGTCAEACIGSFVGICPKRLVISAGSLKAGTCAPKGYTAPGKDLEQLAGPCGYLTFKTYTNPAALVQVEKQSSSSGCANYRRIEDGTCAEACIGSFVGVCPKRLVISAGSLKAGTCAPKGYTAPGKDLEQLAGPCGYLTFKTYTNPAALVQVEKQSSSSSCANYRRIEDGTCADICIGSFVGICPKRLVISAGSLKAGTCAPKGYTAPGKDLEQLAGPCGYLTFKTYTP